MPAGVPAAAAAVMSGISISRLETSLASLDHRTVLSLPLQNLFDDVHAKLRAGKPGFHRASYQVYQNHFHNIPASGEGKVGPTSATNGLVFG